MNTAVSTNIEFSPNAIGPTIFDDVSPFQQTSLHAEQKCNMKIPQHETSFLSTVSYDCSSSSPCDQMSSSSTSRHERQVHDSSLSQQLKAHQPLDPSIADTCQWLINAGVPISAFDPVAIDDLSNSTFCVPQIVSSNTSAFNSVNSKQSKTSETIRGNQSLSSEKESTKTETEPLNFHNGVANNGINSLLFSPQNQIALPSAFQDAASAFDNESLLTDLLPGENLPSVDDSLWAL